MSEIEETAGSYDVDYSHAPVGLFVLTIWVGSLVLGLYAFFLNVIVAKGFGAPYIVDGQRTYFKDDVHGVVDGALVMLVLFVLSLLVSLAGRSAVLKGKKIDGLWKLSGIGIPALVVVLAIIATIAYH